MPRRTLVRAAVFTAAALLSAQATERPRKVSELTLVLRSEKKLSRLTEEALGRELQLLMAPAGVQTVLRDFRTLRPGELFSDLILVSLNGTCAVDLRRPPRPVYGTMAAAHSSDGEVLPFVDVSCEKISDAIRPVILGDQMKLAEALFGRALARVVAHEVYHVFGRTKHHGSGIAGEKLSGNQLLADELFFHPRDLKRITDGLTDAGL